MAKAISDEELQLRKRARRRLVGAIALVTFIAVFLPMVLENEPKPVNQDISVQIPSQNSGAFTSKIVPVAPVHDTKPAVAPKAEAPQPPPVPPKDAERPPPKAAVAESAKAKDEPKAAPAAKTEEKSAPATKQEQVTGKPAASAKAEAKPAAKANEPAKTTAYVVQVAALNDAEKAKQLQQQIKASGVSSYTEQVPTAKGSVTRVRAGPFKTREAAEKAREQLKGMGLTGNVVPK
jgi:DedD protein